MNNLSKKNMGKITVIRDKENVSNKITTLNKKTPDEVLLRRGKMYSVIFASCNLR